MTNYKPPTPSPQFVQSTEAAVAYWRKRTQKMDESTIHWLDTERQNLFQAVVFGLALPQTWRSTADVALQAFDLVERRGYWEEWIPVLEQAVTACTGEHRLLKIKLLSRLGQLQRFAQQLPAAVKTHREAETLAQQLGDKQALAIAHYNLSEDCLRLRDYAATERYGRAALKELDNLEGVEYWEALVLGTLGEMARFRGDLIASEEMLLQAVTIRRQLGQPIPLMRALNNLAITLQTAGKIDEALQSYEEASKSLSVTSYELGKAMVQINLGALYAQLEKWTKAEAALRQVSLAYLSQSNKTYFEAAVMQSLGNVLLKQDRPEEAISYLQRAVTLWQTIDEELEQANSMETLGEAFVPLGRITEALSLYKEAIALLKKFPDDVRAQNLLAEFELGWQQLANK
jgi:tetratricopeptide (TPR) repeat protein